MTRRGMTLIEILVVSALMLALFGVIYSVITPGLRAWSRSEARAEAQQQCLVVLATLTREFQYSNPYFAEIAPNMAEDPPGNPVHHDAMVFLSLLDEKGAEAPDASGDPLWQRIIYIYHDGENHLVRIRRVKIEPPTAEPHAIDIGHYHPEPTDRIVGRNVTSLALTLGPDAAPPLIIHVETRVDEHASALDGGVLPLLLTDPVINP